MRRGQDHRAREGPSRRGCCRLTLMLRGRSQERRGSTMARIDAVFFTFSALSAIWLAFLLLKDGVRPGWPWLLLLVFWVFVSYLLLPRLHRILTRLYIPGYFIGRARTSDGLLGDPVNLALLGSEAQVHHALRAGGWIRADDIDVTSTRRIITSTLRRQSYPQAPVSPLHLFDRVQDFAYQQEVAGSPSKRHHVRFWRCPDELDASGWPCCRLAGGRNVRPQGRPVSVHLSGDPQDRGEHRRRARLRGLVGDGGRPARRRRGDPELLHRLPHTQRWGRPDQDRR